MANQIKHQQSKCCYQNWVGQQRLDLDELLQALNTYPTDHDYLQLITKKTIDHFENYRTARAQLAKHDAPSYMAPSWGTTYENSFLWIGGCRPSLIIRLVYTLCGSQLDSHLAEFLEGESIADEPLMLLTNHYSEPGEQSPSRCEVVDRVMDTHALAVHKIMVKADQLRMDTLKGMIDILTPLQAVELLVASKKLHLSLHEWSRIRDTRMGISRLLEPGKPSSSRGGRSTTIRPVIPQMTVFFFFALVNSASVEMMMVFVCLF
ncbi:hypothetical protein SSX86_006765 [Deinandra increscens subsp. villosa]|uniref:DOG1 domain-containing protein n=1 Tax=Deinandra increscens subsp. villosa TaxID=3103831 RepID=A0AAP0DND5_9ASTR